MAILTGGTARLNNTGQLQNISSLDTTTAATIGAAGGVQRTDYTTSGGGTTQTFDFPTSMNGKTHLITTKSAIVAGTSGGALQIRPANALYPTNYRNMGSPHGAYHTTEPNQGVFWSPSETMIVLDDSYSMTYPSDGIHTTYSLQLSLWVYAARETYDTRAQFVCDMMYINSVYYPIVCRFWGSADFLGKCSGVQLKLVGGGTWYSTSTWSHYVI